MRTILKIQGVWCLPTAMVIVVLYVQQVSGAVSTNDVYGGSYANWPTSWTVLPSLNDPDDGVNEQCDFVGDTNDPCVYFAKDDDYFYFRTRVDAGTPTFSDAIFILVDAVGSGPEGVPEFGFAWDSAGSPPNNHGLELMVSNVTGTTWSNTRMEDLDGNSGQKISPPDFALSGGEGYVRTITEQTTLNFGTTTLIDWAIKRQVLETHTSLTYNQWKIQLGSRYNSTDHQEITTDVACNANPNDTGLSWSAPFEVPEVSVLAVLPGVALVAWRRHVLTLRGTAAI